MEGTARVRARYGNGAPIHWTVLRVPAHALSFRGPRESPEVRKSSGAILHPTRAVASISGPHSAVSWLRDRMPGTLCQSTRSRRRESRHGRRFVAPPKEKRRSANRPALCEVLKPLLLLRLGLPHIRALGALGLDLATSGPRALRLHGRGGLFLGLATSGPSVPSLDLADIRASCLRLHGRAVFFLALRTSGPQCLRLDLADIRPLGALTRGLARRRLRLGKDWAGQRARTSQREHGNDFFMCLPPMILEGVPQLSSGGGSPALPL